jgi:hypothetical protein
VELHGEPEEYEYEDMQLDVSYHRLGWFIRWDIPPAERLFVYNPNYDSLPTDYYAELVRTDVEDRQEYILLTVFDSNEGSLPAAGEVLDTALSSFNEWCGRPYTYTLRIWERDISGGHGVFPMVEETVETPFLPCSPTNIRAWGIDVDTYFRRVPGGNYEPMTLITIPVPATLYYPVPRVLALDIQRPYGFGILGTSIFEIDPPTLGHDGITYQVEQPYMVECGIGNHKYTFSVMEELRGGEAGWGTIYDKLSLWQEALPCLPSPPANIYLNAHMCENNQPCIEVSWEPSAPFEGIAQYPADEVFLNKQTFLEGSTVVNGFHLPPEQTSYIDYDVLPGQRYKYTVYYTYNNMYSDHLDINIQTPSSDVWHCLVHSDVEMWCDEYE